MRNIVFDELDTSVTASIDKETGDVSVVNMRASDKVKIELKVENYSTIRTKFRISLTADTYSV